MVSSHGDSGAGSSRLVQALGLRHPIVQGPFGGGLSSVALAAAVSSLGGLGSFGAVNLPAERIGPLVAELRAATDGPFNVNLWVGDHDPGGLAIAPDAYARALEVLAPYFEELGVPLPALPSRFHQPFAEQVEALLAAAPPVFSFVYGVPPAAVLAECRRRHIFTVGTATTLAEAEALDAAGVDAIVATGMEAGGHRVSFIGSAEDNLTGTFALTQLVAPRVKASVIAAGGICDARGVAAARLLGADAAQIGTAFLACRESGASPAHREKLFSAEARETVLTRAFTGRLARGIANRWTRELHRRVPELPPFPIQSWIAGHLKAAAAAAGRTDLVSMWSGQIAPNLVHHTAADLMRALTEGAVSDRTP
jgi:nitronate monooxygenase